MEKSSEEQRLDVETVDDDKITAKMRLESISTFLECRSWNKIAIDRERRNASNLLEHALALMALIGLCLFVAFVVWIAIFARIKLLEDAAKEDALSQSFAKFDSRQIKEMNFE